MATDVAASMQHVDGFIASLDRYENSFSVLRLNMFLVFCIYSLIYKRKHERDDFSASHCLPYSISLRSLPSVCSALELRRQTTGQLWRSNDVSG